MIVIIAEKPSLARNIVAGIGNLTKKNGYYEGNGYIVTWAFGHLFSLCDIEEYTGGSGKWTMDNLPCFPKEFKFRLKYDSNKKTDIGVQKQFNIIKALVNREDVQMIVNAGDADREGEIIVRLCVMNCLKADKKFYRLWLPDQTVETVREALNNMKDEKEYESLANEGFARTYIDWLYGVNLTRYASLKTGTLLRVGRVIIPIVKAIYDRDMRIKNFVPDIYYGITSKEKTNNEEIELSSCEKFDKEKLEDAKRLCDRYNNEKAIVVSKKVKKGTIDAGKLYSLSKLQNFLGKKYKISMDKSLTIVQNLYERGFLTYPRTNSEYLAIAEKDKVKKIIGNLTNMNYPVIFKDKKTIFDDSKIESHSALTPTYKIPNSKELNEDELLVYKAIFKRFVAVFCSEECLVQKTEIKIKVGQLEEFILKGTIILEKGWTKYDDYTSKDKILPNLNKGDEVNIYFKPVEKKTTPPKHYTIETLNNYLKNPFKDDKTKINEEEYDDAEDYKAIFEGLELGTEATRTGIIDNARKSGYIDLKKDVYTILPNGEFLIESLKQMQINMDKYKTSEMGRALKKVYHNEMTINQSIRLAETEISDIFLKKNYKIEDDIDNGFYGDYIGKCPICGKDVIKNKYGYGCIGYKEGCNFKINGTICTRVISKNNAKMLLETGKTSKIKGFVSKNGKPFDATIILNNGKLEFNFN